MVVLLVCLAFSAAWGAAEGLMTVVLGFYLEFPGSWEAVQVSQAFPAASAVVEGIFWATRDLSFAVDLAADGFLEAVAAFSVALEAEATGFSEVGLGAMRVRLKDWSPPQPSCAEVETLEPVRSVVSKHEGTD